MGWEQGAPSALTDWLAAPRADAGIRLLERDWTWRLVPYDELGERVRRLAAELGDAGLEGARVALVADDPERFLVGLLASLAAGATAVSLPPPRAGEGDGLVPADLPAAAAVGASASIVGDAATGLRVVVARPSVPEGEPAALIQFSSGSTGRPKAIRLGRRAVETNVATIRSWLAMGPEDKTATWLPLFHDMGLIGTILTPVANQSDVYLMTPTQFLRRPHEWVRCFGRHGCTVTAAPPFGYEHAARRCRPDQLDGVDLRGWRVAIVGAEPIRPRPLREFAAALAPYGFDDRAFCPAYGMSEATLVVTAVGIGDRLEARTLGAEVGAELVGSGAPVGGSAVEIREADGRVAPDGRPGEIWVRSPSLAAGYEPPEPGTFVDGWFATGDVGQVLDGQLYVLGRMGDSFKLRGRVVLAEHAEALIREALPDVPPVVVVPSRTSGAGLTVLVEGGTRGAAETTAAVAAVVTGLFDDAVVDVTVVGRGAIPRTTSGKPKRRDCWRQFVAAGAVYEDATP